MRKNVKYSEVRIEYEIDTDKQGFCVNVDVGDDSSGFDSRTVPAYLILVAKNICRESGIDFNKLLQSSIVVDGRRPEAEA